MMNSGHMMMGWGGMIFGPVMMLLFLGLITTLIVLLVKWVGGTSSKKQPSGNFSLNILKERFARGEINREEYEERRSILQG